MKLTSKLEFIDALTKGDELTQYLVSDNVDLDMILFFLLYHKNRSSADLSMISGRAHDEILSRLQDLKQKDVIELSQSGQLSYFASLKSKAVKDFVKEVYEIT